MAKIDLEQEYLDNRKRKKRAKLLGFISSFVLTGFVIISYLGYTVGQHLANATTVTLLDKSEETGLTEIGFRVPNLIPMPDQTKYSLAPDEYQVEGPGYVYWTTTTVSGQTLRYIVSQAGYSASNSVQPATSGRFTKGDPLTIYKEPEVPGDKPVVPQKTLADASAYIAFTILFKVSRKKSETSYVPVKDYGIYFNKDIQFYGELPLIEALRFGFESEITSDIISPNRIVGGVTPVGGRLDLNRDGYYDTTLEGARFNYTDPVGYVYEAAYGDFINPLTDDNWGEVTPVDISDNESLESTFYNAKTKAGVRPLVDYTPAVARYAPMSQYQVENPDGGPIGLTDDKGIAEVDFKIWLEGWDKSSGDHLRDKTFGANLRFTASEVNVES